MKKFRIKKTEDIRNQMQAGILRIPGHVTIECPVRWPANVLIDGDLIYTGPPHSSISMNNLCIGGDIDGPEANFWANKISGGGNVLLDTLQCTRSLHIDGDLKANEANLGSANAYKVSAKNLHMRGALRAKICDATNITSNNDIEADDLLSARIQTGGNVTSNRIKVFDMLANDIICSGNMHHGKVKANDIVCTGKFDVESAQLGSIISKEIIHLSELVVNRYAIYMNLKARSTSCVQIIHGESIKLNEEELAQILKNHIYTGGKIIG